MRRRALTLLPTCVALALAPAAAAHGPSVKVAYANVRPAELVIRVGDTVHFQNANRGSGVCTIVADDESFASPTLTRETGWHHTFPKPGRFSYPVREFATSRGAIVVVDDE